jgi:hypothetical protein
MREVTDATFGGPAVVAGSTQKPVVIDFASFPSFPAEEREKSLAETGLVRFRENRNSHSARRVIPVFPRRPPLQKMIELYTL